MGTLFILFIIFILVVAGMAIRVVPEYQRLVKFRLGRSVGAHGPGLVILVPVIDQGVKVDLRERFFDVPPQTCITKDNAPVSIDFLVYMKIIDAEPSVLQVEDLNGAARGIAITTLRAVVGDMPLDDVLSRREEINEALRGKLDEVTSRWGIKVSAVEIREIIPPPEIQEAMSRQMSAERSRRALVTEADGKRDAAIRVAEGERQATVLEAEGKQRAMILEAEGKRQSAILEAEGYSMALGKILEVARNLDSNTMALQYLEALKSLGATPSSKLVIPAEFTNLIRPFLEYTRTGPKSDGSG